MGKVNTNHELRGLSRSERHLLQLLVAKAGGLDLPADWIDHVRVHQMNDGGMGSLLIASPKTLEGDRKLGRQVSDYEFVDDDGVKVLVALNIDQNGDLFEIDIWKTDFGKLLRLPDGNM